MPPARELLGRLHWLLLLGVPTSHTTVARSLLRCSRSAAPALLGCRLVREGRNGRRCAIIVETEAYPHDDPASHSYAGPTTRNAAMFGEAGLAYVYRIHRCYCLNVVTGPAGRGEAVLIRALQPEEGMEQIEAARRAACVGRGVPRGYNLTNGPGKLCQALEIGPAFNFHPLLEPTRGESLTLLARPQPPRISRSPRIGISRSQTTALRFFIADNPWVSA